MKMKKRCISMLLVLTVAVTMIFGSSAGVFAAVTDTQLPASGGLKWSKKLGGSGRAVAMTPPAVDGNYIYVASAKTVYKLNKSNGSVAASRALAGSVGYHTLPLTCEAGMVFVPIGSGQMQVFDTATLTSRYTTEKAGGQVLSRAVYSSDNNCFYYTTWQKDGKTKGTTGFVICVNAADGTTIWKTSTKGNYWSAVYADKDIVVFGQEDGYDNDKAEATWIFSCGAKDGSDVKEVKIGTCGSIRSDMVYDNGYVYFTSKEGTSGWLHRVKMDAQGNFGSAQTIELKGASVSTPLIYKDRIYVGTTGTSVNSAGYVQAINKTAFTVGATVKAPGYPQGEMLLSTAESKPVIYATYNTKASGICRIVDNGGSSLSIKTYFAPDGAMKNYGLSSVACDTAGTIYYINDSGYMMAVSKGYAVTTAASTGGTITETKYVRDGGTYSYKATPKTGYYISSMVVDGKSKGAVYSGKLTNLKAAHTVKANFKKLDKVTKVKATAGKKKVTLKWKRNSSATGYQVYRATKAKGKYSKVATIKKNKTVKYTNKKLKKGKKYYYKVRAYKTVNGKTTYGSFSSVVSKKAK